MPRPKKIKPEPIKDHSLDHPDVGQGLSPEIGIDVGVPIDMSPIKPRDIIQITSSGHTYLARIGIVHEVIGNDMICYAPGKNGFPHKFKTSIGDVSVVGKARLAFSKPLPEDSVYSDVERDKI